MSKPTVAVIFGSRSAEHDISIVTALSAIVKPLELTGRYHVVPVYIAKDGSWYSDPRLNDIAFYTSGELNDKLARLKKIALRIDHGLKLIKPGLGNRATTIDVAFPATHGTYGEDGSLMGLLRMANVPFVGCDMAASAIAMDKVLSKIIAESAGVASTPYVWFAKREWSDGSKRITEAINKLKPPLFVKPAHLGSSIAITKVEKQPELENAIEVALHYDDKVIVEQSVQNLVEVTVPIMGNEELAPAMVEEPLLRKEGFFGFDTKYMQGGKKGGAKQQGAKRGAQGYSRIPAKIPEKLYNESLDVAQKVYRAVGCEGIARIDLLIDSKAAKVMFNEINPLPGSLYAHNWKQAGVSTVELVAKLIDLAFERHERQEKLTTVFDTNFLKQF